MLFRIPTCGMTSIGLDGDRSWVVISEGNEFLWPGHDVRKLSRGGRYDYGFLPPRLFEKVLAAFVAYSKAGRAKATKRD